MNHPPLIVAFLLMFFGICFIIQWRRIVEREIRWQTSFVNTLKAKPGILTFLAILISLPGLVMLLKVFAGNALMSEAIGAGAFLALALLLVFFRTKVTDFLAKFNHYYHSFLKRYGWLLALFVGFWLFFGGLFFLIQEWL